MLGVDFDLASPLHTSLTYEPPSEALANLIFRKVSLNETLGPEFHLAYVNKMYKLDFYS